MLVFIKDLKHKKEENIEMEKVMIVWDPSKTNFVSRDEFKTRLKKYAESSPEKALAASKLLRESAKTCAHANRMLRDDAAVMPPAADTEELAKEETKAEEPVDWKATSGLMKAYYTSDAAAVFK
jgi:hypothetical protein